MESLSHSPWVRTLSTAILLALSWAIPTGAAPYVVDGLVLGEKVPLGRPDFQSYSCRASTEFARLTVCTRSQTRSRGYSYVADSTVTYKEDGASVSLAVKVAPVQMTRAEIEREIGELSKERGGPPSKLQWEEGDQRSASVIASWGDVRLETTGYETDEVIADGKNPAVGLLIDTIGDPRRSAQQRLPIYRVAGGTGYIYAASYDRAGRGHRHYLAVVGNELVIRHYDVALRALLRKDQTLPATDISLWPEVAKLTRQLSRDTSPAVANQIHANLYENFPSKKLHSRVWSILPGGTIDHIAALQHWNVDIYRQKTEHPEIRRNIIQFLSGKPKDPFVELLNYVVEDYEGALAANPNSIFKPLFHYARGYQIIGSILDEILNILKSRSNDVEDFDEIQSKLVYLLQNPELYDNKPLITILPDFSARAAAAAVHFETVLRNETTAHADDAAYLLGWLTLHQDKPKEALRYFSKAMTAGNGDYKDPGALRRTVRILLQHPSSEQLALVRADDVLGRQPAVGYVAARSVYREHNYALAIEAAERALRLMKVPLERLPATTEAERVEAVIKRFDAELVGDPNFIEIPYLLQASKEMLRYEAYLKGAADQPPDVFAKAARAMIVKYSMLVDKDAEPTRRGGPRPIVHRDLRQAIRMIDLTLATIRDQPQHRRLREWLHYRKIRIIAVFRPASIQEPVAALEREFPGSQLLDDALAEQVYAETVMLRAMEKAEITFRKLVEGYPRGNAVDNAYSWMAIGYRCANRPNDAERINKEIIRRFPLTRHARYARERLANPDACGLEEEIR